MTHKRKQFLILVLAVIAIAAIGFGTYVVFFSDNDQSMRVKRVGPEEIVNLKASDYKKSSLNIYPYGAFEIEIIKTAGTDNELILVGIGTYTKTKTTYTFTFIERYERIGSALVQNPSQDEVTYDIVGGRIRFIDHNGISYYFGK